MKMLLISLLMRGFSWITPRVGEVIAPPIAGVLWYLSPRKRRVTRLNLSAVYPNIDAVQLNKIARASMTHYVRGVFEAGMLWHWPLARIFDCFDATQGLEHYRAAQRAGAGVIIAGGHCGSWELAGLYMQQELKGSVLYKPGRHPDFEAMLVQKRSRGGAEFVPTTGAGLRTMFKHLKTGQTVGMVADQEPSLGEGQFAPFYGIETLTGVLLPRMARRTDARVVFVVCERRKKGRYCMHMFKADEAIYSTDKRAAVRAVNHGIEQTIAVDPEQYLWAYKRFRNRPDGKKSFYR